MRAQNRNFMVSDDIHRRFKILAAQRGRTLGDTLRYLLDLHRAIADQEEIEIRNRDGSTSLLKFKS